MKVNLIAFLILFFGITTVGWSQPQNPQGDPDVVPITGIEYLLIAGGAYGAHRFSKRKNKMKNDA